MIFFKIIKINSSLYIFSSDSNWDYIMVAEYGNQETFCKMAVSKEYTDIVPHKVQPCFHHAFTIIPHKVRLSSFYQVPSIKYGRMAVRITLISFHISHHIYHYQSRLAKIVSPQTRALEDAQAYLSTHLKM